MNAADDNESQSVPLTDEERLRTLGYDAKLGRPLGFWSATAMNMCHLGWTFELSSYAVMYSWKGPLLFVIGYPFSVLFHLLLLGVFSEMASAYPVAGAMASWSWKFARAGVGNECRWGWAVSGIVLAAHLGKILVYLYNVANFVGQLAAAVAGVPVDPITQDAINPPRWWHPTFDVAIITIIGILLLSRASRSPKFWIAVGALNLAFALFFLGVIIAVWTKASHRPPLVDFPTRSTWTHSFSYTVFMGIPFKTMSLDCPAHMSEETVEPARNVPRIMFTSTIIHFALIYPIGCLFIYGVVPLIGEAAGPSPMSAFKQALGVGDMFILVASVLFVVCCVLQILANFVVTSRFVFALGRDRALPFSDWISRTSKDREPWIADLVVIGAMYISVAGYFVNKSINYNLIQSGYWLMSVAYIVTLVLYLFADIDLQYTERSEFSLGKWSKPFGAICTAWLFLPIIQGCMPVSFWNIMIERKIKPDTLSAFPFVLLIIGAMLLVSWFVLGHHYLGPIRALTTWSAGVEINPRHVAAITPRRSAFSSMKNWRNVSSSGTSRSGDKKASGSSGEPSSVHTNKSHHALLDEDESPIPLATLPPQDSAKPESQLLATSRGGVHWPQLAALPEGESINAAQVQSRWEVTRTEAAMAESELDPTATTGLGGTSTHNGWKRWSRR